MNLRDLRDEINSALDYNPDLKQYDDNLTRVINRHYLQVSSQYQWLFMQRKLDLLLRADIDGTAVSTVTADGSHKLALQIGTPVLVLPRDIEGQTFVLDNVEYEITRYIDARTFVVDDMVEAGVYSTWKIQYQRFPMPRDCVEVLGVMDRGLNSTEVVGYTDDADADQIFTKTTTAPNRGRFIFLDARKEEYLYLDRVDTGDPFVSVEEMHANIPPPDFAPSLRLKDSTGLTSVVRNATYEYCYTFLYAGMESPPSPVASVDTTTDKSSSIAILIERLMDTSAKLLTPSNTGRVKKIYRRFSRDNINDIPTSRLVSGMGPWRHIATVGESTTYFVDDADELTDKTVVGETSYDGYVDPSGELFRVGRLNEIGPRQYLRFWNTPNSDYLVETRYHRRPFRLVNDADAPEWPVQYHHYLVYAALKDICMQHGMLQNSELYDGRAKELMERMKSKYLSRTDRMHIRRGFDRAMADRERFGIPSKS